MNNETEKILETLSPNERKILPYIREKDIKTIIHKSKLDETSILRALQFLENKNIVKVKTDKKKVVDLGNNGVLYLKNGLPERKLLNMLAEEQNLSLEQAQKLSKLSENEFKAALGVLKNKALAELKEGKLILNSNMDEVIKKTLEEKFLESLPLELETLEPEQKHALKQLEKRKDIIKIEIKSQITIELTELGQTIIKSDLTHVEKLIENLTPEMIRTESWKGKKFRRYDIQSGIPQISGGKRHFVNQAKDQARKIWTEMGFKEMNGNLVQSGFWNFDALFTAQDHPVRDMHDTFFIKYTEGKLPDKKIFKSVKQAHESGVEGSKGWQYQWKEDEAKKVLLRTHTTCLSAQTLASIRELKDKKGKYFAIGKCFRNETVDWSHGFEFNQTEGIVIDKDADFRHLLGYLKEFFKKMGFEKVRFKPSYFSFTEPSVEAEAYHPEKKKWIELVGAGIFRPEVVVPLLGEYVPILAWGVGFDRLVTDNYQIHDLRELYKNDISKLRKIKYWTQI